MMFEIYSEDTGNVLTVVESETETGAWIRRDTLVAELKAKNILGNDRLLVRPYEPQAVDVLLEMKRLLTACDRNTNSDVTLKEVQRTLKRCVQWMEKSKPQDMVLVRMVCKNGMVMGDES